jgi:DNA-binding transcriptional LysR family regulator
MVKEGVFAGQLQAFSEVARLGNITRAADMLFLSQPALTARLKRLEQELGVSLLVRDRRGARLTEAGRAFLPHVEVALAALAAGETTIREFGRQVGGRLTIAATPTMSAYVLPKVVKRFLDSYPDVQLTIVAGVGEQILDHVLKGTADIGFGRALQHPDVECKPLYEEEYVVVGERHHPRAGRGTMKMADFADEVLILWNSSSSGEFTRALQRQAGVVPRVVLDVDSTEAVKRMTEEGVGLALMPRSSVTTELAAGSLREITISDTLPLRRTMAAIRRRGAPEITSLRAFLRVLEGYLKRRGAIRRSARARPGRPAETVGPAS